MPSRTRLIRWTSRYDPTFAFEHRDQALRACAEDAGTVRADDVVDLRIRERLLRVGG